MTRDRDAEGLKWRIAREIPHLRRFARSLVRDPDRADDLVQDCIERAIRKRHLWRRVGTIRSWLFRMLYRVFLNQNRGRAREVHVQVEDVAHRLAAPASQEDRVVCHDIGDALDRLPAEQRAAILLVALEGVAYDEAAEILGVPVGTVRSRLSRGREALRSLHQEEHPRIRRVK